MPKFNIRKSTTVGNTRIALYKLTIDQYCQIEDFESSVLRDGTFKKDIEKIYAILSAVCNLSRLPKTMFRVLKLPNMPFHVYEAKSAGIRYYLIKIEKTGKVIILAGKKSSQKTDLKHLAQLVKEIHKHGFDR